MAAKYGTPYFSNYVNSDMKPSDIRSMCPLTPDTEVFVRSKENGISIKKIGEVYHGSTIKGTSYQVWTPEGWCEGHPIQVPATKVYKFTLSNGFEIRMGENHLQPTRDNGTLMAKDLKKDMWIPFSKRVMPGNLGTYDLGYAVGAYAGDGSHDDGSIIYSLATDEKDDETEKRLVKFWSSLGFETRVNIPEGKNIRFLVVRGNPYDIVKRYVIGQNALEKDFSFHVFNSSEDFRQGIIDGYWDTDGAKSQKRLYTSSPYLRRRLVSIFSSLGKKALAHYKDSREGRLGTSVNYRVDFPSIPRRVGFYDEDESFDYYRIVNVEEVVYYGRFLYCFEVDNKDHLFTLASGLVTHNCRLRLDLSELRRKNGGFFGSGDKTGSVAVISLNMPRLAYKSNNIIEFYNSLDKLMDIAAKTIEQRREFCTKMMNDGLYPYTKRYLGNFDNHFSTIGLVGMNEACLNAKWIKNNLTDKKAQAFTKAVLNHMRDRLIIYQEEYGHLFNLEATPAESTAYRFAKKDKEMYPDIITASDETPYYTNSSHLPVGATDDIFDALDIQDELQTLYTSGTVFHAFLGEKLPDWKSAMDLVRKIASNYKLPYFTLSPTFSICKNHGYIQGEEYTCPSCHEKTEVYSRITGYYRPVQNWNNGKAQEFKDRKEYKIDKSNNSNNNAQDIAYHSDDTPDDVEILTEPVTEEIIYESEHAPGTSSNILFDGPGLYLFTTPTCPKCKFVKQKFAERNIHYFLQDVTDKECEERAVKLDIKAAPTLVSVDTEDNITVYSTVNEIINYINT